MTIDLTVGYSGMLFGPAEGSYAAARQSETQERPIPFALSLSKGIGRASTGSARTVFEAPRNGRVGKGPCARR